MSEPASVCAAGTPLAVPTYRRREPEHSLLHVTVRENLRTFLAEAANHSDTGAGLPRFVAAEFERYLACGILANGFARVRCAACAEEILVAFSCKGRGICPSCTTRRMQSTALYLTDRVLPHVPMRQWVLSLPRWARFLLARDAHLITRTLGLALRAIFAWQRRRARKAGARAPRTGAVTFVQRFGGSLNLNVHFHCVIPDGVFVREAPGVRFRALDPPSDDDVKTVLSRIALRVRRLLRPRLEATQADARPPDVLGAAQAESVSFLFGKPPGGWRAKKQTAYHEGFSLHAGVHLHANDRQGLAHLCGYGARPPLTQDRLSALPDGRLAYRLKRPLADVFAELRENSAFFESGFAWRFLFALVRSTLGERTHRSPTTPESVLRVYADRLTRLLDIPLPAPADCPVLRLAPAATEALLDWEVRVQEPRLRLGGELSSLDSWGSKLASRLCRVAGLFHCADAEGRPWDTEVSLETMRRALNLAPYFIAHARAVAVEMNVDPNVALARRGLAWLRREERATFSRRELHRATAKDEGASVLDRPLEILETRGFIRPLPKEVGEGGRPSARFQVNPDALRGG